MERVLVAFVHLAYLGLLIVVQGLYYGITAYLLDFKEFDGGYITFGGGAHGGRITGKRTLKTDSLDFEDVYFVNELKFNLFSVSQMCDKKNNVLFTDTECLVLSPNFKLPDESQILLKIPRKDNMYSFYMKNIVPKETFSYLVAKATSDESMLWHRRLGHINFKSINKLVKDNLVRGLPTKHFENDQTCVGVLKGSNTELFVSPRENGIKREYSVARTPQQNGVAERRNRTLIEAARTMLADSKLPTTFWAEAVSTACYVQNRVLVVKPHNKTPYELFRGFKPALSFMRPFRCHVTILNTLDSLGKFDGKSDEGVQGELNSGTLEEISQDCNVMPIWKDVSYFDSLSKDVDNGEPKSAANNQKQVEDGLDNKNDAKDKSDDDSSPNEVNVVGQHVYTARLDVNTGSFKLNVVGSSVNTASSYDQDSPKDMFTMGASHTLEATHVEFFSDEDEPEVDLGNITNSYTVPTTPNTRIHKDHPIENVIGDVKLNPQAFLKLYLIHLGWKQCKKNFCNSNSNRFRYLWIYLLERGSLEQNRSTETRKMKGGLIVAIRLFLAYASFMGFLVYQMDMKSAFLYGTIKEEVYLTQPLGFKDPDHPDKVYKVVKALYGLHQAPRAWYETLANYLLGNGFKRGKIDQTLFIKKQKEYILLVQVYVDDIIFGSTNKELCTGFEKLMKDKFQMSSMGELTFFLGLQLQQKEDGIFISRDKYVAKILKKFNYIDVKSASPLVDLEKPLVKDGDTDDVDVYLYRSMIGSLMYLIASRPDIIYLKSKPTLGLYYSRDSPFELVAYTDSDYAGATQDRKSTIRSCQFLGNRLISWQCKKQTVVATSTTEAEYVAAASC
ncbi:putative ribonuclease H-like domain-containing protein [Tanacetum coccineum]|uniref:Ribonuclease H-like domain-containing protein n=1 Tax=Tanacetum coccineum TaxID=301880 RepID=A0ABQ5FKF6_9ASTR